MRFMTSRRPEEDCRSGIEKLDTAKVEKRERERVEKYLARDVERVFVLKRHHHHH